MAEQSIWPRSARVSGAEPHERLAWMGRVWVAVKRAGRVHRERRGDSVDRDLRRGDRDAVRRAPGASPWIVFTGGALLLAVGPFIKVAGHEHAHSHAMGVGPLLARVGCRPDAGAHVDPGDARRCRPADLRGQRVTCPIARPWLPVAVSAAACSSRSIPRLERFTRSEHSRVLRSIAADKRPVRVLTLPFGLRDGSSSYGNYSASTQFYQTVHEKGLLGGYLSRLPRRCVDSYRRLHRLNVLMDLSAGRPVSAGRLERAIERAHLYPPR